MATFNLSEFVAQMQNVKRDLANDREKNTVQIGVDMLALVRRRVIQTGRNSDGQRFSPYSQAVVPYWYFGSSYIKRGQNADFFKARQKDMLAKHGYFGTYPQFRVVANRTSGFKNFQMTGRMLDGLSPILLQHDFNETTIELRNPEPFEQDKVGWHSTREGGPILALDRNERDILTELNRERVEAILKKNGLL